MMWVLYVFYVAQPANVPIDFKSRNAIAMSEEGSELNTFSPSFCLPITYMSAIGMAMWMWISASTFALSDNIALYPTYVGYIRHGMGWDGIYYRV